MTNSPKKSAEQTSELKASEALQLDSENLRHDQERVLDGATDDALTLNERNDRLENQHHPLFKLGIWKGLFSSSDEF